ncbi:MAG: D-alanine--D-alanine ligase family protein [Halorhodospira sp.]
MRTQDSAPPLRLGVLFGDPRLPYAYGPYGRIGPEELQAAGRAREALAALPGVRVRSFDDHRRLIDELRADPPDLALNLCDNGYRNHLELEPNIPALLEMLAIPYTGAGMSAMCLSRDKAAVRALAASVGVAVPEEVVVDLRSPVRALPERYPAVIKPNDGCGSMGMEPDCVVHNGHEARAYLARLAAASGGRSPWVLVQEFLPGTEYTIGLIGNPAQGITAFPPLAIDYTSLDPALPPILSYGSKIDPASPYYQALRFAPAELTEDRRAGMVAASTRLFARLGGRDYARVDFREDAHGVPRLLDFNTQPSWSHDGKLAIMAGHAGYSYAGLLQAIVEAAVERYAAAGQVIGGRVEG